MLHATSRLVDFMGESCPYYAEIRAAVVDPRGPDTRVPLTAVLDAVDLRVALWALHCVPQDEEVERDRVARLFAADCAERVLELFEFVFPDDKRPRRAIAAARWAVGKPVSRKLDKVLEKARREARNAALTTSEGNIEEDFAAAAWAAYGTTEAYAAVAAVSASRTALAAVFRNTGEMCGGAEAQAQIEILRRYLGAEKIV